MSAKTTIEWTDRTWNPVRGCSLVSAGCTNCYAMKQAHRFSYSARMGSTDESGEWVRNPRAAGAYEGLTRLGGSGPTWTGKIKLVEDALLEPLRWRGQPHANGIGQKRLRVFVNSMSDLFHEGVPAAWIDRVLAVIALTPHITYQVLTKRAERLEGYFRAVGVLARIAKAAGHLVEDGDNAVDQIRGYAWPLPNLHLGVSVENRAALTRLEALRRTPAAVRFVSAEPLLEDLGDFDLAGIDQLICGGESGHGARPMHPDWPRRMRDRCAAAGVPFFFKQWGEWLPYQEREGLYHPANSDRAVDIVEGHDIFHARKGIWDTKDTYTVYRHMGKKRAGRLLDGREWNGIPGVRA